LLNYSFTCAVIYNMVHYYSECFKENQTPS